MAISWGSYDGHLRLGIDIAVSTPSASSTTVTVVLGLYIQCQDGYRFDDPQHWTLDGPGGGDDDFYNGLSDGDSQLLYSHSFAASISYAGGPTYSYSASLSGAYNGADPTASRSVTLPARPPSAPSTPGAPTVGSVTATTATVSWSAPSGNGSSLSGNAGQVSRNSSFTDIVASWSAGTWQTSHAVVDLPKGTVLYARVRAHNSVGWSSWSGARTFTTGLTAPSAPGPPGVSNIGPTSANVTWSPPVDTGGADLTNYEIQRATDASFTTSVTSVSYPSSPGAVTGLLPGTTYYLRARAVNVAGPGPWSTTAAFTTLSGVKVGDGTAWRDAIVWVGNGSSWVLAQVKVGNGTVWK